MMSGVLGAAYLLLIVVLVCLCGEYKAEDVQNACVPHHGVAQVQDNTWGAGDEKAFVVCRDGVVATIK